MQQRTLAMASGFEQYAKKTRRAQMKPVSANVDELAQRR